MRFLIGLFFMLSANWAFAIDGVGQRPSTPNWNAGDVSYKVETSGEIEKILRTVPGILAFVSAVQFSKGEVLKVTSVQYNGTLLKNADGTHYCAYEFSADYTLSGGDQGQITGASSGSESYCIGVRR